MDTRLTSSVVSLMGGGGGGGGPLVSVTVEIAMTLQFAITFRALSLL